MNALPAEVKEVKDKGATVLELTGENDEVYYLKKPTTMDMERYLATTAKGKLAKAVKNLVYDMAIKPTTSELKAQFKDKPGLMVALNNELQRAVGMNEDFSVKKL
jgi:hypothetical protein